MRKIYKLTRRNIFRFIYINCYALSVLISFYSDTSLTRFNSLLQEFEIDLSMVRACFASPS